MRTKTMLLGAAIIAAGALSSMAQSVYSLNVVGYVNVTLYPGLNLISAPLQSSSGTSNPQTVLANCTPDLTANSSLFVFNPTNSYSEALPPTQTGFPGFNNADAADGANNWVDADFNTPPSDLYGDCPPGSSFFIYNDSGPGTGNPAMTNVMTIVGTVVQGTTSLTVYAGINFLADPAPVAQDITTNGFPIQNNDALYTWGDGGYYTDPELAVSPWGIGGFGNPQSQYNQSLSGDTVDFTGPGFSDSSFTEVPVALAPGQGFVYVNVNTKATWSRTFTVH